ncbi:hypothetical protein GCM10028806_28550 [Spirosoma terrae]|uniref:SGNH/GDSL hydrolase family protein n=1 Tax=Spirosoma terrae TaxID=1968276 RepID=A0A6L9L997_9BACT|nr:SGNH/GDSL hydrolase family protein [Spirosoma terrae]NDU97185.1 SGNH/GDSL hydrolase family protein [Spirosoma terrae]
MKIYLATSLLSLISLCSVAQVLQPKAMRVYRVGDMVAVQDSAASKAPDLYPVSTFSIGPVGNNVRVGIDNTYLYFPYSKFLGENGTVYSQQSSNQAVNSFKSNVTNNIAASMRTVNYTEPEIIRTNGLDVESTGLTYPSGFPASATTTVANSSTMNFGTNASPVSLGGFNPPLTKKWYVDHYTFGTTMPVFARVSMGRPNTGDVQLYTGSGSYAANAVLYGGDGAIAVNLYGKTDTTRRAAIRFGFHGYTASADNDVASPYYVYLFADSNTEGTSVQGITSRWDVWSWKLKAWYQNVKNQRVFLVDKSLSGQTSVYFDKIRLGNRLGGTRTPSIGFYVLGTNDTDTAAYRANVNKFISDWIIQYPDSPLIICGPGPRSSGSTGETTAGYMRAIDQQVVGQVNRPKQVYYLNLGTAFPNTSETYFTTNDSSTSGNRVHWNVGGQQKVFEAVTAFLESNKIELYLPPN